MILNPNPTELTRFEFFCSFLFPIQVLFCWFAWPSWRDAPTPSLPSLPRLPPLTGRPGCFVVLAGTSRGPGRTMTALPPVSIWLGSAPATTTPCLPGLASTLSPTGTWATTITPTTLADPSGATRSATAHVCLLVAYPARPLEGAAV